MQNKAKKGKPPCLCTTFFHVVDIDQTYVDIRIKPFAMGPAVDACKIFDPRNKLDNEKRRTPIVPGMKPIVTDDNGAMIISVKRKYLPLLAKRLEQRHGIVVPTGGMVREDRIGFINGSFTPCATPYEAMKLACNYS